MTDYDKTHRQAGTISLVKEKKVLSKGHNILLYVFFGNGIGAVIMAGLTFITFLTTVLSRNEITEFNPAVVFSILIGLALFYPFALAIGGIPAILTGWILNFRKPTIHEKMYSFVVGFVVCFVFYFILIREIETIPSIFSISIIGGIAAAGTKRLIEKKELRL